MGYPVRAAARAVASPPALTIGYEALSSRQRRKGEDDATSSARFCADQPDEGQRSQYDLRVRLRRGCPATPRHQVAHARQRLGLQGAYSATRGPETDATAVQSVDRTAKEKSCAVDPTEISGGWLGTPPTCAYVVKKSTYDIRPPEPRPGTGSEGGM